MSKTNPQYARPEVISPRRRRGMDFLYVVIGVLALVVPMIWVSSQQSSFVDTGYRINELRQENALLREQQMRLKTELEHLSRPARIFDQALAMGLRPVNVDRRMSVNLIPLNPDEVQPDAVLAELDD